MAKMSAESVANLITPTDTGVKVDLKTLYVYPDGHANLVFKDGSNWPLADEYEVISGLSLLLRRMQLASRKKARG